MISRKLNFDKATKKYIKTGFLSICLFSASIFAFNTYNVNDYINKSITSIENKSVSIKNNDDFSIMENEYTKYDYTKEQYIKDQDFFKQAFSKEYYYQGFDGKFRKGFPEFANRSFNEYIKLYYMYKGNPEALIQIQKATEHYKDQPDRFSDIMNQEYFPVREKLFKNNNEKVYDTANFYFYIFNDYQATEINNYNKLFIENKLPTFLFNKEEIQKEQDLYKKLYLKKDDDAIASLYLENNKTFVEFLNKIEQQDVNEVQKYNFFKMVSFINYKINKNKTYYNAETTYSNMISRNIFFREYINVIDNQKYYKNTMNRVIVEDDLNSEQRDNLLHSKFF